MVCVCVYTVFPSRGFGSSKPRALSSLCLDSENSDLSARNLICVDAMLFYLPNTSVICTNSAVPY